MPRRNTSNGPIDGADEVIDPKTIDPQETELDDELDSNDPETEPDDPETEPDDPETEEDSSDGGESSEKKPIDKVVVQKARCRDCGSTAREKYFNVVTREIAGELPDGKKYTHITWKRTRCANPKCTYRPNRVEIFHENRPTKKSRKK